jgi:hypothetical protein
MDFAEFRSHYLCLSMDTRSGENPEAQSNKPTPLEQTASGTSTLSFTLSFRKPYADSPTVRQPFGLEFVD